MITMRRYDHYCNHLAVLMTADKQDLENEFIISGIEYKFFIQFELGWKVLKELLSYEGIAAAKTGSPRDIIKEAYKIVPCMDEETWLSMLSQRNNLAHIYDGAAAKVLVQKIIDDYIPAFQKLKESISERYADVLDSL